MASPLTDLLARLDDLEANMRFVESASKLRPRLADVLDNSGSPEIVELARKYMGEKQSRVEAIFAALLVRVLASLERYLRKVIEASVERIGASANAYEELPEGIRSRNFVLSGRVIAASDSPKDYQTFDYERLVANLASCRGGSKAFRLNPDAFSTGLVGSSPENLERALKAIDIEEWWDEVVGVAKLQSHLEAKNRRDGTKLLKKKLVELSRWRNQIAHAGEEEVVLTHENLVSVIALVRHFAVSLDQVVSSRLSKHRPPKR